MTACTVLEHDCTKAAHADACRLKGAWSDPRAASAPKREFTALQSQLFIRSKFVYLEMFSGKCLFVLTAFRHNLLV